MFTIIMVIAGILLAIASANAWFVVPAFCIYICFGLAAISLLIQIIVTSVAKKQFKNINDNFKRFR